MRQAEFPNSPESQQVRSAPSAQLKGKSPGLRAGSLRTGLGALLAGLFAVAGFVRGAPAVQAAGDPHFDRFWVYADAQEDSTVRVEIDRDFDFGDVPGDGILLSYNTQQAIEDAPEHLRVLKFSDVAVASNTGASIEVETKEEDGEFSIHIKEEGEADLTALRSYQVFVTTDGVIAPGVGANGEDEIYWNVIGGKFQGRIENARVELTAPSVPLRGACAAGAVAIAADCDSAQNVGERGVYSRRTDLKPAPDGVDAVRTAHLPGGGGLHDSERWFRWGVGFPDFGRRRSRRGRHYYRGLALS